MVIACAGDAFPNPVVFTCPQLSLKVENQPSLISGLEARSSNAYKRHTGCRDRLWQKGYHDRALRRDEDLQQAARYIVANPLRAGLVKRLGDYPLWDAVWL
jgi:hypothetical protein